MISDRLEHHESRSYAVSTPSADTAFYFEGWDLDPRETQEIPEIRANFLEVTAEFPYWLHFVEKEGETLLHLFRLLCRCHSVRHDQEPGLGGWRFDDLREFDRQLGLLFNAMNHL